MSDENKSAAKDKAADDQKPPKDPEPAKPKLVPVTVARSFNQYTRGDKLVLEDSKTTRLWLKKKLVELREAD